MAFFMSADTKDQPDGSSGNDQISFHLLREEDFPWFLLWMTRETHASLSLLSQTTKGTAGIIIITGILNRRERISMMTVYAAAFTRLRTAYTLGPGEFSIQQLQLNPLIHDKPVLYELLPGYMDYLFREAGARKIFWEISHLDTRYAELARKAGFRPSGIQDQVQYTLYEYAGTPGHSLA